MGEIHPIISTEIHTSMSFTQGRKSVLVYLGVWVGDAMLTNRKLLDLKLTSVWGVLDASTIKNGQWNSFAHEIPKRRYCDAPLYLKEKLETFVWVTIILLDQWAVLPWQNQSDRNAWSHGQMLWWFGTGTLERHPEERCTSKTQGGFWNSQLSLKFMSIKPKCLH